MKAFELLLLEYNHDITLRMQSKPGDSAERLGSKLLDINQQERLPNYRLQSGKQVLLALERADPTPNKKYMIWIVNQYKKGEFSLSDIQQLYDDLTVFDKLNTTWKSQGKSVDIGRYTYSEVKKKIDSKIRANYSYKKIDINPLLDDWVNYYVLPKINTDGSISREHFLIPITRFWQAHLISGNTIGKPTRWCIKKEEDLVAYNSIGRLFVLIDEKTGDKFLLHPATGEIKDVNNSSISFDNLIKKYPGLNMPHIMEIGELSNFLKNKQSDVSRSLHKDEKLKTLNIKLKNLSENERTYENSLLALYDDWDSNINYVPKEVKSLMFPILISKLVQTSNSIYPEKEHQYLEQLKIGNITLQNVPNQDRTFEICLYALQKDNNEFLQIPSSLRSDPLIAFTAIKGNGIFLSLINDDRKNIPLCLEAVKQNGRALEYVPEKYKTPELCLEAVKNYGMALGNVPEKYRSLKMCLNAIQQNGYALQYVPEQYKSRNLCILAVTKLGDFSYYIDVLGWNLSEIPKHHRTKEVYLAAVAQDGFNLQDVPFKQRTPQVCFVAVSDSGLALQFVPEKNKILKICTTAVKEDPYALEYVPAEIHDEVVRLANIK